jgi:hypothetical protein
VAGLATALLCAAIAREIRHAGPTPRAPSPSVAGAVPDHGWLDQHGRPVDIATCLGGRAAALTVLWPAPDRLISDGRLVSELARAATREGELHVTIVPRASVEEMTRLKQVLSLEGEILLDPRGIQVELLAIDRTTTLLVDRQLRIVHRDLPDPGATLMALRAL